MSQLRFITQVLYRLKRRYGQVIDIVERDNSTVNLITGVKTVTKIGRRVLRAIVLPSRIERDFEYDLTFIATNKNFTYGGLFDKTKRRIIIDRKDIDFEIKVGMYLVIKNKRYDVKQVEEFEEDAGYFLIGEQTISQEPDNVVNIMVASDLLLSQEVT